MKLQKPLHSVKNKICDEHGTIKKVIEENQILREQLLEATDKQHQEMSRAIDHMEKNVCLKTRIHDVKQEACKLLDNNRKCYNAWNRRLATDFSTSRE